MKDNFKLLNNVDMDLDKYEDLNIDKDKLKKKMNSKTMFIWIFMIFGEFFIWIFTYMHIMYKTALTNEL